MTLRNFRVPYIDQKDWVLPRLIKTLIQNNHLLKYHWTYHESQDFRRTHQARLCLLQNLFRWLILFLNGNCIFKILGKYNTNRHLFYCHEIIQNKLRRRYQKQQANNPIFKTFQLQFLIASKYGNLRHPTCLHPTAFHWNIFDFRLGLLLVSFINRSKRHLCCRINS